MMKRFLPWLVGAVYFLCPYDLLPDFLFGPGWVDDLVILGLIWWWNVKRQRATPGANAGGRGGQGWGGETAEHRTEGNPYEVLGVGEGASMEEIRSAYKRLVAKYHPDKVQHLGPEFQKLAHEKFIAVQQAYEKLKK
jgi:hypothetical protein